MLADYEGADAASGVKEWHMAELREFEAAK